MANFLYAFGSTLLSLAYTFDLASQGLGTVLGFYLAEFILLGAIVMPILFYLYEKIDRQKWGLLISLIAFCPIIFLPFLENHLVVKSILYSLALSTYWTMFHIYMTKNANYDNKGNDLSVALNTVALGALAGVGLITILAQYGVSFHHISLFGSLFFFLGIYLLNRFEAHAKRLNVAA